MNRVPYRREVLRALRNFPSGAQARAVNYELGVTRPIHRSVVTSHLSTMAREGLIKRRGEKGSYYYFHPDHWTPDPDAPTPGERTLPRTHPAVVAAREAAGYLRPDLARRLTQLADWATGARAS